MEIYHQHYLESDLVSSLDVQLWDEETIQVQSYTP